MQGTLTYKHETGFASHKMEVDFTVTGQIGGFLSRDYTSEPHIDFSVRLIESELWTEEGPDRTRRFGDGVELKRYDHNLSSDIEDAIKDEVFKYEI